MSLRVLTLVVFALLTQACGSHFVKGWRGDDAPPPTGACFEGYVRQGDQCVKSDQADLSLATTEQACKAAGNNLWTADGQCVRYKDATKDQCDQIAGWIFRDRCMLQDEAACVDQGRAWLNSACVEKPAFDLSGGVLPQTVTAGVNFTPIDIKIGGGVSVDLVSNTCGGFLSISGAQLVAKDTYDLDPAKTACEADLVARAGATETARKHVAITVVRGFYAICQDPASTSAETDAVFILTDALKTGDCKEANEALVKLSVISLADQNLADLGVFRGLRNLKMLNLARNDISDVSPLAGLTTLQKISLVGNPIEDGRVAKTEANCPTGNGAAKKIAEFCAQKK